MKFLSIDSPLMQFLSKAADFMLLSLFFVISSLPVFTIGPAATAMYSVFIKRSNGFEGSVVPLYWKMFKENFKNAMFIELILLPLASISAGLIVLISCGIADNSLVLMIICFIPGVLTAFAVSYAFPLTAQFENSPVMTVKNAYLMPIGTFPIAIAVTGINLLPAIICAVNWDFFLKTLPFFSFLGFALMSWADEKILRRIFKQYFPKEKGEDK